MTTPANGHKRPALHAPTLVYTPPLLVAEDVARRYGRVTALAAATFSVYPGEVLGVVGESGSGKSTLLRLLNLEEPADGGTLTLNLPGLAGVNLLALDRWAQRDVRVRHIGIVYQNPHQGLRMGFTSSGNVAERLLMAGERSFATLRTAAQDALAASEFPLARMDDPPRVLSGGMQQRVQLAKALALRPALLLLDEPTTGLDVSVQALVLDTLKTLVQSRTVTVVLVSHDLGVIRTLADRVLVMRGGHIVERGLADQVLEDPQHPYTQQLVYAKL